MRVGVGCEYVLCGSLPNILFLCNKLFVLFPCVGLSPRLPLLSLHLPSPSLSSTLSPSPSIQIWKSFIGMTGPVARDGRCHTGTMRCDGDIHMIMPSDTHHSQNIQLQQNLTGNHCVCVCMCVCVSYVPFRIRNFPNRIQIVLISHM